MFYTITRVSLTALSSHKCSEQQRTLSCACNFVRLELRKLRRKHRSRTPGMKQHSETKQLTNDTQICLHSRIYIQYNTQPHSLHTALPVAADAAASTRTRHKERSSGACAADDSSAAWPCHDSTRAGSENKRENGYSPFPQRGHSCLEGMRATPERNKGSSMLSHSHSHSHTTLAIAFARLVVTRTQHKGHTHTSSTIPAAPMQALTTTPTQTPATRKSS